MDRQAIIDRIESLIIHLLPGNAWGCCLHYAHAAATALWEAGERPVIQAGSLQWPALAREDDDGISPTHFSYLWDPSHHLSRHARANGLLPEMHVWVGLVDHQELIDFSTRDLRRHAGLTPIRWTEPEPPAYLWCQVASIPDRVIYDLNRDATILASQLLFKTYQPDYLEY